jgi:fumarate hydratase class II
MSDTTTRVERDTMGEMEVPADAYYGASTQRAVINFPVSGIRLPRRFLRAVGLIKRRRHRSTATWARSTRT